MQSAVESDNKVIVALLTESVDWNKLGEYTSICHLGRSPHGERGLKLDIVAYYQANYKSLSSRRAWIEILELVLIQYQHLVALLTESVDWNV